MGAHIAPLLRGAHMLQCGDLVQAPKIWRSAGRAGIQRLPNASRNLPPVSARGERGSACPPSIRMRA
jgi:hypothetical protein